jgi:ABC-type bacteriocin/lantibiotic exporter with double-glycine peptidase domain
LRTVAQRGRSARPHLIALAILLLASGCTGLSRNLTGGEVARGGGWESVENVPEVRQSSREGCGAAALAMVLGHWGRAVTQEEIWESSPPPSGQGMRADSLRDFARGQGLEAFIVEGQPADLDREVRRERPVLVGVMKRQGRRAYPHYEVVVGLNRERQRILTLDPAGGPRERSMKDFTTEWAAAGRLTLVVLPPTPAAPPIAEQPWGGGDAP